MNAVDWQGRHQSGGCIEREGQGPGATPTLGSLSEPTGLDVQNGGVRTGPIVQSRRPWLCEIEIQPRLGPGRVALRGPSLGATSRGPTAQYSAIRKRASVPPSLPLSSSMPPAGRAALRRPQAPRHRPGLGDTGAPLLHPSLFAFN